MGFSQRQAESAKAWRVICHRQRAFADPQRVILSDEEHSADESRYYCVGRVGGGILTVRFTYRNNVIRIFGAGYWRKGKKLYEEQNHLLG
jgi:uncharacterized DUF497 family protein